MQISSFIASSRRSVEILRAIAVPAAATAVAIVLDRACRHTRKAENRFGTVGQFPIQGNGGGGPALFFLRGWRLLGIAQNRGAARGDVIARSVATRIARISAARADNSGKIRFYDALFAIKISIADHRATSHSIVSATRACAIPQRERERERERENQERDFKKCYARSLYSRGGPENSIHSSLGLSQMRCTRGRMEGRDQRIM